MECELWPQLYAVVVEVGKSSRQARVRYRDTVILLVFFWACLHDRPVNWACEVQHWRSTRLRPVNFPTDSTMSRRLPSDSIAQLMKKIEDRVRVSADLRILKFLDGKPLPIGGCSKDPDAKAGRAHGSFARGYRLSAIWSRSPFPETWAVRPLNENEVQTAKTLIPQLRGGGYILADGEYDTNQLHDLAGVQGHQLVAPRRKTAKGLGHQRHSPYRLRALELLRSRFGQEMHQRRACIERLFGNATSFGGGLAPLPAWVRRIPRVQRWVWAKLVINAIRIRFRQQLTA